MKVLLASTATDNSSLAGIHHGYGRGFQELGHDVTSISHAEMGRMEQSDEKFDFFLLRDTFRVPIGITCALADRCRKFALFTHSECLQANGDAVFIEKVSPDYVFLDQPLGHTTAFSRLDVPMTWLGYGANHACRISQDKDIDIAFFGNAYPERQPRVVEWIYPFLNSGLNVKIYGKGQEHGSLTLDEMFEAMSRTKIALNVCGAGCPELGYGGRRILDAMASGCAVVADRFALDREMYGVTGGAIFVETYDMLEVAMRLINDRPNLRIVQMRGYKYVRENWMISHVCQKMIELVGA